MKKVIPLIAFSILLLVPVGAQNAYANTQITLEDLGILQLAAHDLFNVDRGDRVTAESATDFENGKLDLSTLFVDMTTGTPFSLADIAQGGEPRNRENIILFSVASRIGQTYQSDVIGGMSPENAKQKALNDYHTKFNIAYFNAFGESAPSPQKGCVTMTENLAFRTVHDFLPGTILKDGDPMVPIFSLLPPFTAPGLTDAELLQLSSELDGVFDAPFTVPLTIDIVPGPPPEIIIPSLLAVDTDFAFQFNTDFPFVSTTQSPYAGIPGFLTELQSGSYASTNALDQIRNLVAKGYGGYCYVGGEYSPIETTSLLLAGAQTNLSWIIPAVLLTGIAAFIIRKKSF